MFQRERNKRTEDASEDDDDDEKKKEESENASRRRNIKNMAKKNTTNKRRPSAYISFSVQNRESVKRELAEKGNAKPGMGDIARLISQRWNALGEEEKRAFKEKCEKEFEEKEAAEEEEERHDDDDDDDDDEKAPHDKDGKVLTEAERLVRQTTQNDAHGENRDKDGNSLSLPLSRVKRIMKLDKSVKVASGDATKLITKATELFCEVLTQSALGSMKLGKRKTIKYLDVERAVLKKQKFDFLHDHVSAMKPKEGEPKKMTEKDAAEAKEKEDDDGENTRGSKKISDFFAKTAEAPAKEKENEEVAAA